MKMNKSGSHMKEYFLILMLSFIFLFILGFTQVDPKVHKMEKGFIDDINKHKDMKIGLVGLKSYHLGSTGRKAAFGLFGHFKSSKEKKCARNLDMKYYKVLEEEIIGKAPFQLKSDQLKDIPKFEFIFGTEREDEKNRKIEKNRKLVKKFIESNDLRGALFIKCSHFVRGSINNSKVTLDTYWIMYGHDGREVINISTYYEDDEKGESFANTLDPKNEATFLKFFETSADDFISVLMKSN